MINEEDNMAVSLVPQREFQLDHYSVNHSFVVIQKCIEMYVSACNNAIKNLEAMFDGIAKFRTQTNSGRTVATGAGVTSTVLTVTGVALAGPTLGASLALTATGIGLGVAAGLTTVGVEFYDYYETKDIISKIESILKELDGPGKALDDILKKFKLVINEMTKYGYTEQDALARILIGVAKGVVDVGRIGQNAAQVAVIVANMPVEDGFQLASNLAQSSASLGPQVANKVVTNGAARLGASGAEAASAGGKALQSSFGVMMGLTVGFGVAFTVLDIVLLVNAWSKKHKTAKAIKKLIKKLRNEMNIWKHFSKDMRDFVRSGQIHILHQRILNMYEENRQMRQEFEELKSQMKKEFEERERQMKKEFEERQARMEAKQNEMLVNQNEVKDELAEIKALLLNKILNNNN